MLSLITCPLLTHLLNYKGSIIIATIIYTAEWLPSCMVPFVTRSCIRQPVSLLFPPLWNKEKRKLLLATMVTSLWLKLEVFSEDIPMHAVAPEVYNCVTKWPCGVSAWYRAWLHISTNVVGPFLLFTVLLLPYTVYIHIYTVSSYIDLNNRTGETSEHVARVLLFMFWAWELLQY